MTIFDGEPDTSVAFVAPRSGKIVRGEDIAKTTARRATEEERWRYGVELRILGSRWRPQTRAPHYPAPEPYVYRKRVQSLAWQPYRIDHHYPIEREYEDWLIACDKAAATPKPEKNMPRNIPTDVPVNVVRLVASTSTPAREDMAERKAVAAQLLRDIAGEYGPRRAHKLRAMADWLTAPAAQIKREG